MIQYLTRILTMVTCHYTQQLWSPPMDHTCLQGLQQTLSRVEQLFSLASLASFAACLTNFYPRLKRIQIIGRKVRKSFDICNRLVTTDCSILFLEIYFLAQDVQEERNLQENKLNVQ